MDKNNFKEKLDDEKFKNAPDNTKQVTWTINYVIIHQTLSM